MKISEIQNFIICGSVFFENTCSSVDTKWYINKIDNSYHTVQKLRLSNLFRTGG